MTKECIAKVKFWFGIKQEDIFNTDKYDIEYDMDSHFVCIYEK